MRGEGRKGKGSKEFYSKRGVEAVCKEFQEIQKNCLVAKHDVFYDTFKNNHTYENKDNIFFLPTLPTLHVLKK